MLYVVSVKIKLNTVTKVSGHLGGVTDIGVN